MRDDLKRGLAPGLPRANFTKSSFAARCLSPVDDALVDTDATGLLVPSRLIAPLGLDPVRTRPSRTIAGLVPLSIYRAVRLTVEGRECISDVAEIPDEFPVVIGQVPLELMDWVVDPRGQRLIGNPEHGGEHMIDV